MAIVQFLNADINSAGTHSKLKNVEMTLMVSKDVKNLIAVGMADGGRVTDDGKLKIAYGQAFTDRLKILRSELEDLGEVDSSDKKGLQRKEELEEEIEACEEGPKGAPTAIKTNTIMVEPSGKIEIKTEFAKLTKAVAKKLLDSSKVVINGVDEVSIDKESASESLEGMLTKRRKPDGKKAEKAKVLWGPAVGEAQKMLKALSVEIDESGDGNAPQAIAEIRSIFGKLEQIPDTPSKVKVMVSYLKSDTIINEIIEEDDEKKYDIRKPLNQALKNIAKLFTK